MDRFLLRERRGALFCACLFLVVAVGLGCRFFNDEGLLLFDSARAFAHEPLAFLFSHRMKPPLLFLYALPASLDIRAFLIAHSVVAAAGVYLACRAAHSLGIEQPNLAGWVLATSTTFLVGASNGWPNTDGAVFLTLFLFLYLSQRRVAAALVLGLLPLVRYELALVTLVFLAYDVRRYRDWRFVLTLIALPGAYAIAGAVYHGDPFWLDTVAVKWQQMPEEHRYWYSFDLAAVGGMTGRSFILNSPVLLAFFFLGAVRAFSPWTPKIVLVTAAACISFGSLAVLQVYTLDLSYRFHLAFFPLLAVVAAHGWRVRLVRWRLVLICAAITWQGLLLGGQAYRFDHFDQHKQVHEMLEELRARDIYRGQPVFSDLSTLVWDPCTGFEEVHHILNAAMVWEIMNTSTVESGQRDTMLRLMDEAGIIYDPSSHEVRRDAVYILQAHTRAKAWQRRVDEAQPARTQIGGHIISHWPDDAEARNPVLDQP